MPRPASFAAVLVFACAVALVAVSASAATATSAAPAAPAATASFSRADLQAWCIVPFDARKRTPEDRAQLLLELGLRRYAYDWRAEHIPEFEREIRVMRGHGIAIAAWWFPATLNDQARTILATLERTGLRPELWVTGGGAPVRDAAGQAVRIAQEVARLRPIAEAAARLGCKVGLYNHGGWFGDPDNQLAVLAALRAAGSSNVGLVWNFHHAHDHIRTFDKLWPRIAADVLAVNLSGLVVDGDRTDRKIMPLGAGDQEYALLKVIRDSGWRGPLGVLSHRTEADAADTLRANLAGFDRLLARLAAEPPATPKSGR
jgi:hypothetical protein